MTIDWCYNLKMILDFYAHYYTQMTFKPMSQCSYLLLLVLKIKNKNKKTTKQPSLEVES